MKNEIDIHKFVTDAPSWKNEEQRRFNHTDCPAGEDTRERLYIKHTSRGWVGHCFNCNHSGAFFRLGSRTLTDILAPDDPNRYESRDGTKGLELYKRSLPIESLKIKAWLYKYHLMPEDWKEIGMRETVSGNLIYPYSQNRMLSFQRRVFESRDSYYKYMNYVDPTEIYSYAPYLGGKAYFIVEDIVSAYRIHRDTGICAVSLMGTNMPELPSLFGDVCIWLDGDVAGKTAALNLHKELVVRGYTPTIVRVDKSPKEYTPEELKDITSHLL